MGVNISTIIHPVFRRLISNRLFGPVVKVDRSYAHLVNADVGLLSYHSSGKSRLKRVWPSDWLSLSQLLHVGRILIVTNLSLNACFLPNHCFHHHSPINVYCEHSILFNNLVLPRVDILTDFATLNRRSRG